MAVHSSVLAWEMAMHRGAWWAAVHGVTKNGTRLKRLSMPRKHARKNNTFLGTATFGDKTVTDGPLWTRRR